MMPLFISATRNYPENVLKPKSRSCTRFNVWHIDGGHITQEVQYKPLRETPHSDASKHPKHQQELFQLIPQLLPPAATVHTATHVHGFGVEP